jgi:uncharacterized membrane protein YebE (DUF533 family)
MSLIDIGIVGIDAVFVGAVAAIGSCLAYLVYATFRERAELKAARQQVSHSDDAGMAPAGKCVSDDLA